MRSGPFTFLDHIFENELTTCVNNAHAAYSKMVFSEALRSVWYDLENLRSQYSILTNGDVHADIIRRLVEDQMVTLSPIAPHFCEYMWRRVLGKDTLVVRELWPTPTKGVDAILARQYELIQGTLRIFRLSLDKIKNPKKKKENAPPPKPSRAVIFVAKSYKTWQVKVMQVLQQVELTGENDPVDKDFMRSVRGSEDLKALPKEDFKQVMPFASYVMNKEVKARGKEALELELPFDEAAMLQDLKEVIKRQLNLVDLEIADASLVHPDGLDQQREKAEPAQPQIVFLTE